MVRIPLLLIALAALIGWIVAMTVVLLVDSAIAAAALLPVTAGAIIGALVGAGTVKLASRL